MSVNEKINELRKLNYYVKQDSRDFPNPFLLLSDNQALNKLLVEGQGKPKVGPQVIQGSDDTQEVYDIGASNSRLQRARHVREQQARENEAITRIQSRFRGGFTREGVGSLYVREPSGASRHHAARMSSYRDDDDFSGGGGGGGGGLRPEQMTDPRTGRQPKLSASKGREVLISKAQQFVNSRQKALDKAIREAREEREEGVEPEKQETRFEKAKRLMADNKKNLRGKK